MNIQTRQSKRLRNMEPKTELSETQNIFTRVNRQKAPASEPIIPTQPAVQLPPQTSVEEAIPLSKDEIIRILLTEMPMDRASVVQTFMERSGFTNEVIPSIYSSYFFRKDIIREFEQSVKNTIPDEKLATHLLSTYKLYNKDDILNNTMTRPGEIGSRFTEKSTTYTDASIDTITNAINYLSKNVCIGIKATYAKAAVENALLKISRKRTTDAAGKVKMAVSSTDIVDKFDILLASTRKIENVDLPIEERLSDVAAFIIVELGECQKYSSAYSINLICADTRKASGVGSILMGAYLYTILCHPLKENPSEPISFPTGDSYLGITSKRTTSGAIVSKVTFGTREPLLPLEHVAVLELADAYINPGGLCMYEKFGFTFDPTMYSDESKGINCFSDRDNLPMLIDFVNKPGYSGLDIEAKKNKVIQITSGNDRGFPKDKICSLRDKQQELLGYLKNMKLLLDNEPGFTPSEFMGPYQNIYNNLLYIHEPQQTKTARSRPPPTRPGTIDEFIDYLENPPQPDNPDMASKVATLIMYIPKSKKGGRITRRRNIKKIHSRKRH